MAKEKLQSHGYMGVIFTAYNTFEMAKTTVKTGVAIPFFLWESLLLLKDGEPVGMDEVEWCCNPIYLWESLLHGYIRQKANPGIGLQVAIPFIYGSHCYGDEFSIECEITKVDKGCNPIFLWESLLLTKWKNVLYLNENKLQSHFHMGVIATSVP